MSPAEKIYYEDQKIERKQFCDRAVDPVWYTAMMKKQRLRERGVESKKEMVQRMAFKSIKDIEEALTILEHSPNKIDENLNEVADDFIVEDKKRKLFENEDDALPMKYRHIRDSARKVKESVYRVVADLVGRGMSLNEAVQAILAVSNGLFDRTWSLQEKCDKDKDTRDMLPSLRSIREALGLIETQTLAQTVDKMVEARNQVGWSLMPLIQPLRRVLVSLPPKASTLVGTVPCPCHSSIYLERPLRTLLFKLIMVLTALL